jgi:hypothetical protein
LGSGSPSHIWSAARFGSACSSQQTPADTGAGLLGIAGRASDAAGGGSRPGARTAIELAALSADMASSPGSTGCPPRTMFMSTSADCACRSCSAEVAGRTSLATSAGCSGSLVRCRLFWNHTCTCLARTFRYEASCCRSSLPGQRSSSKTRSSSWMSSGFRIHRLGPSRSISACSVAGCIPTLCSPPWAKKKDW